MKRPSVHRGTPLYECTESRTQFVSAQTNLSTRARFNHRIRSFFSRTSAVGETSPEFLTRGLALRASLQPQTQLDQRAGRPRSKRDANGKKRGAINFSPSPRWDSALGAGRALMTSSDTAKVASRLEDNVDGGEEDAQLVGAPGGGMVAIYHKLVGRLTPVVAERIHHRTRTLPSRVGNHFPWMSHGNDEGRRVNGRCCFGAPTPVQRKLLKTAYEYPCRDCVASFKTNFHCKCRW